jgi:hypothetical protein
LGNTSSANSAVLSAMRRAPAAGHKPRRKFDRGLSVRRLKASSAAPIQLPPFARPSRERTADGSRRNGPQ